MIGQELDPNWSRVIYHPCRILIVSGFESGKMNALLNLTNHQPDIGKIFLYSKDSY